MLKESELVGVHCHLPHRSASVHRQADRAGQELRRPSRHRHREHAAAQRADGNRWSSRRRPRRCFKVIRSSPANWSRSSMQCWRTQLAFARPSLAYMFQVRDGERLPRCRTSRRHRLFMPKCVIQQSVSFNSLPERSRSRSGHRARQSELSCRLQRDQMPAKSMPVAASQCRWLAHRSVLDVPMLQGK